MARAKSVLPRFRDYFGRRLLRDIKYSDLRSYYTTRLKEHTHYDRPPTIATMNRELGVLRRIFHIGVREGWITRNPFQMGEPLISPASERRRERILTLEEEGRLLAACENPQRRSLTLNHLPTRHGRAEGSEFLQHLRWHSVNFDSRTVIVEAMTTKTLKGRQVIMTERMSRELYALREASSGAEESRVFSSTARQVRFGFRAACKEAGISYGSPDGITLHSLRHTAATRLVKGQMPIQLVGRILGHSQPQTTYRYLSADGETASQAASIFEAFQAQRANTNGVVASHTEAIKATETVTEGNGSNDGNALLCQRGVTVVTFVTSISYALWFYCSVWFDRSPHYASGRSAKLMANGRHHLSKHLYTRPMLPHTLTG